jgi:hypothetical protein
MQLAVALEGPDNITGLGQVVGQSGLDSVPKSSLNSAWGEMEVDQPDELAVRSRDRPELESRVRGDCCIEDAGDFTGGRPTVGVVGVGFVSGGPAPPDTGPGRPRTAHLFFA